MKIAWTLNTTLKAPAEAMGYGLFEAGTWLETLLQTVRDTMGDQHEFAIIHATHLVSKVEKCEADGVQYFLVPKRSDGYKDSYLQERKMLRTILEEFGTDLLHVHGTEDFYGLLASEGNWKTVVSIQGFREHIETLYFTDISYKQFFMLQLKARKYKWLQVLKTNKKMVEIEHEIFRRNRNYIGRTDYDRYHSTTRQLEARYFGDCHDIIRAEFMETEWEAAGAVPLRIHTTMTERPYKGILFLLKTLKILKTLYPEVRMTVGGSMNGVLGKFAKSWVKANGLESNIEFLGRCTSQQLVDAMQKASVFVLGSYVENESLSLQEAQAMGMPLVAPFVGGVSSMFEHKKHGYYFPTGDVRFLAGLIGRMFAEPGPGIEMGKNARKLVFERNDPAVIGPRYERIYNSIMQEN